jgi:hypothetical protein
MVVMRFHVTFLPTHPAREEGFWKMDMGREGRPAHIHFSVKLETGRWVVTKNVSTGGNIPSHGGATVSRHAFSWYFRQGQ